MKTSSSKQMSPGLKFFFSRIFPLIFVMVGVIVVYIGIRGLVRAKASVDWPTSQGKIVSSSVERHRSTGSNDRSSATYHAEIMYEFSVKGTTYNGERVAYGEYGSSDPSHARRIVNRYPNGKEVTVYYMPDNPEECLLEPGMQTQAWLLPGFGLIFFVVGALMAILLPKAMRRQKLNEQGPEGVEVNNAP